MKKSKKWIGLLLGVVSLFQINILPVQAEAYWPEGPTIAGDSAIVMEASTGTVLYEKNSHQELYPASITKIMTALLAVENSSLDEQVTFSANAVYKTEGSGIWRDVDEVMTMKECLYALMLESANECAYAIAEHVGGNYDTFVQMMNDKATELGCQNTHFNNPHGLPDESHHTSAYDMALISRAALQNETFRLISSTKRYTIPATNKHAEETYLSNHHKMLNNWKGDSSYLYEGCIGGKTGYTTAANSTLVTFAERDGMTLICVVMNEESPNHYVDTTNLLNYCFENFQLWNVAENENNYTSDKTENKIFANEESFLSIDPQGFVVLPKAAAFTDAVPEIKEDTKAEDKVGTIQYTYADRNVGGADIKINGAKVSQFPFEKEDVSDNEKKVVNINTKYILIGILVVILLVGIGFGIYHFADNFYLIRYKLMSKRQKGFKEIKQRKQRRRKRWF